MLKPPPQGGQQLGPWSRIPSRRRLLPQVQSETTIGRQHEDENLREAPMDFVGGIEAVLHGHANVEDDEMRREHLALINCLLPVGGLAADHPTILGLNQKAD